MTKKMKLHQRIFLSVFAGMGLAALLATASSAQPQFDPRIEKAAADQVAKRLGTLRDTFGIDEIPDFVTEDMQLDKKRYLISGEVWEDARDHTPTFSINTNTGSAERYRVYKGGNVRVVYHGTILQN